jgi:hypothetical protein
MSEETDQPLFRREAVRHNTPGLFGEVRLSAPPGSWILTLVALIAVGLLAAMAFGLKIEGQALLDWMLGR